jgi:hypothetical protein
MKSGRITAFSFAYAVIAEHKRDDGVNVLDELDVLDVTITPNPANRNARLVSVKTTPDPEPTSEIDRINKRLDELAGPVVRKAQPGQVEAFLLEEKQRYVEEAPSTEPSRRGGSGGWTSTWSWIPRPSGSTRGCGR